MSSRSASSLVDEGRTVLQAAGVPEPLRDAEVLLAHVLGVETVALHTRPDMQVEAAAVARYRDLVARRAARHPLQHLTGVQEFWSLTFKVTPAVLIPRPETEGLVEAFLRLCASPDPVVLDIGTGSGCLAVTVAREIPGARVFAVDVSEAALAVARENAGAHGVAARIDFRRGDLFGPFRGSGAGSDLVGRVDFILTNPPYLAEDEFPGLMPEVRDHEPRGALSAGQDALAVHRRLARECLEFLKPGGHLIAEMGLGQEANLRALYSGPPRLEVTAVRPDLAGIPRVLVARARG